LDLIQYRLRTLRAMNRSARRRQKSQPLTLKVHFRDPMAPSSSTARWSRWTLNCSRNSGIAQRAFDRTSRAARNRDVGNCLLVFSAEGWSLATKGLARNANCQRLATLANPNSSESYSLSKWGIHSQADNTGGQDADALTGPNSCGSATNGVQGQGRCGYGPRLPLLLISPWAKIGRGQKVRARFILTGRF